MPTSGDGYHAEDHKKKQDKYDPYQELCAGQRGSRKPSESEECRDGGYDEEDENEFEHWCGLLFDVKRPDGLFVPTPSSRGR